MILMKKLKKYDTNDIFIIGGESIYKQFIYRCDTVYVTHNSAVYETDTYMPNLAFEGFVCKQIIDRGISDNNDYWIMEEWVTSECEPYRSVLWFNDSVNDTIFLYADKLNNWRSPYSNKLYAFSNAFRECISNITSNSDDKTTTVIKIHDYYRAEINVVMGEYVFRLASFGATKDEANYNLVETITNVYHSK